MDTKSDNDQRPEMHEHDQLTGALSGQSIQIELSKAIRRAEGSNEAVGATYVDIDSLKDINDQYGRKVGDMVLKQAAGGLRSSFGDNSKVGRIGDDEFLVVSIGISLQELVRLAESAKQSTIGAVDMANMMPQSALGISIGIALNQENNQSTAELIDAAYKAMYLAKRHGRSQAGE